MANQLIWPLFYYVSVKIIKLIIFKLGESLYGVDINHIREVVDPKKIIKIPKAPEYIEGIMDLRGHVVTLISLSKILEIPTNGGKEKRKVLILMDNLADTLRRETEKWLYRLKDAFSAFTTTGKLPDSDLVVIRKNIDAYIRDSRYFMSKGDLVRAFEAVVYGWGLLEACQHLGLVKK